MPLKYRLVTLSIALMLGAGGGILSEQALANGPGKSAREARTTATSSTESQYEESSSDEDQSANSSAEESSNAAAAEPSEPVSLLSIFSGALAIGIGIVALLCIMAVAHVIPAALVWHGGNILRGGKKPEVG